MIAFFWLALLLAASPLLAKSIAPTVARYQEDALEVDQLLASGRSSSLPERFLQIAHKNCQGPERQPGICMFNFKCQQQRGKVVGACLDGFLFGACCHLSTDLSMSAAVVSTLQAVGVPAVVNGPAHSSANAGDVDLEVSGPSEPPNVSSDLIGYGSLRVPAAIGGHVVADDANKEATPVLPLVLMFQNESVAATANSGETQKQDESHLESAAASQNNKGSQLWSSDVGLPITALPDNQISLSSAENPTTAGSLLLDQVGQQAMLQPTASSQIEAESSKLPTEPPSAVPNRVPPVRVKGQSNKRPRPKPSTASTKTVEMTSTAAPPPPVENALTTTTSSSVEDGNVAVTESLADQQANLLQFLVSNPPAWVLDEIINGSTLTTWYPLPIAESGSLIDLPSDVVAPSSVAASAAIRPLKRKPVKNRPQSTSKISPTTAPTINQMEDDDGEISESPTTVASITTTDPATTSTVTTRKRKPVFDYVKGIHGITLLITVAVMAGSCIAVPMGSPSSSYGGYSYQTTTATPYYTTTYAAPSYYTTKAPEYYPTTYAAPTYYTEAPKYYSTKAPEYYTTITYAAPTYYTEEPKYYSAPSYYTGSPVYYTTTYATPSYYTEAPTYYTTKAPEYYTTTYASPVYYTKAPKYDSAPSYTTTVSYYTTTEAPKYYVAPTYYTEAAPSYYSEPTYYTEAPKYYAAPSYYTTTAPSYYVEPTYYTTTYAAPSYYTEAAEYYTTKAPEYYTKKAEYYTTTYAAPAYYTEAPKYSAPQYTTTYAAPSYYTEAPKYYTTTYAAPVYYTEAPQYYTTKATEYYTTAAPEYYTKKAEYYTTTYAAPAYYTESPKYYQTEAPQYYTTKAPEYTTTYGAPSYYAEAPKYYTTTYAAPAYYTEAAEYYTTKAAEYYTTTYAAPAYYTEAPKYYQTEAPRYYTTKAPEYTTAYATPSYYTEAPKYYTTTYATPSLSTTLRLPSTIIRENCVVHQAR